VSALQGFRIIELAEGVAGEYCGKLIADCGAEVIKIERPGVGSPTRAMSPICEAAEPREASGLFGYLNTNKRSVTLDLATEAGVLALHELIGSADAVIDDHGADWLERVRLAPGEVEREHPALVVCSVTNFGCDAPADLNALEALNVLHASGWGYHTPTPPDGSRPPLKGPGRFLADYDAGIEGAICLLACLYAAGRTGRGEFIDISTQDVLVSRADTVVGRMIAGELEPRETRDAFDHRGPTACYRCDDGFVYLFMTSRGHWAGLRQLVGEAAWLDAFAPDWLEFGATDEAIDSFRKGFAEWVADKTRSAVCENAQRLGVPLVPVNNAHDLQESEQFRFRGFFQRLAHPVLGEALYPTAPYRMSATPVKLERPAPHLGQDNGRIEPRPGRAARPGPPSEVSPPFRARGGPLQGVRVLELTKVWAGPYAGKILAMLGAEVIKVESLQNMDEMRVYGGADPDNAPHYLCLNPEILSVQLDLKAADGVGWLRRMAVKSDIVLNNIKPGAMERAGLGYADLRQVKPDVISVSLKMNGDAGPLAYQTGYAPCFAALGGMNYLVGYEGEPPRAMNMSYGDSTCGALTALGALIALLHRERSGEGQFVDVSAVECMASLVGDSIFEYALTGNVPGPDANRHAEMAPHGCYPCRDGAWLSIAVRTEAQWRSLCAVLKAPQLAQDPRFGTLAARQAHLAELDEQLSAITRAQHVELLAALLRAAGVPAFKSQTALDLVGDAHLWRRGIFTTVANAEGGLRPIVGPSWRMARAPTAIEHGAPKLGEHNSYVYGGLLGLSAEEVRALMAAGVVR
jgi:crotonobetainyl-CoA:carnitine CoA-transferase CaiB-like acyl-CoA transferase